MFQIKDISFVLMKMIKIRQLQDRDNANNNIINKNNINNNNKYNNNGYSIDTRAVEYRVETITAHRYYLIAHSLVMAQNNLTVVIAMVGGGGHKNEYTLIIDYTGWGGGG